MLHNLQSILAIFIYMLPRQLLFAISTNSSSTISSSNIMENLRDWVEDKPVVIFSKSDCCMCHTIKQLMRSYGVNPTVYELDQTPHGQHIDQCLQRIGQTPSVPAVFIGQSFVGGAKEVFSLQVQGKLTSRLKDAGAIWM